MSVSAFYTSTTTVIKLEQSHQLAAMKYIIHFIVRYRLLLATERIVINVVRYWVACYDLFTFT